MPPSVVIEALDVSKDFGFSIFPRAQSRTINGFDFERVKEAFCYCIVPAISFTAHALPEAVLVQCLPKQLAGKLHTAVGMHY